MKKIAVLVAAYNGEKYIQEQLESILSQIDVHTSIYISLDKSSDTTYEIIQGYLHQHANITLLECGKRYGSAGQNFFRLISEVDVSEYDYISFADQDDIWLPSKLSRGLKILTDSNADAYSSNVLAYWESGKVKLIKKSSPQVEFDFLFESPGPGCTFIFKKEKYLAFQRYIRENTNKLSSQWLHDWLCYSYYRGNNFKWIIDEKPLMLYRQHQNNEVGGNMSVSSLISRAKILLSRSGDDFALNQALFLDQSNFLPITLLRKNRLGYLRLAIMSNKLRRKPIEKLFCMVYFMIKFLRGY